MLAVAGEVPLGPGWAYEFKWDGVRAIAEVRDGILRLFARTRAEITKAYPELAGLPEHLRQHGITDAVLDGEVVQLDARGHPDFIALAERMHVRDAAKARSLADARPITYMIFDIISANGTDISRSSYVERRAFLEDLLGDSKGRWQVPPYFTDGPATIAAAKEFELEGVVAKRLTSSYRPGQRSGDWVKVKYARTGDYLIGGWRSTRRALSGLLVGLPGPDGLIYRGRVGGGISAATERTLLSLLHPLRAQASPFARGQVPREDALSTTWVRPELVVEVRYGQLTPDGRLRFPVFLRLRPDKRPEEAGDA